MIHAFLRFEINQNVENKKHPISQWLRKGKKYSWIRNKVSFVEIHLVFFV